MEMVRRIELPLPLGLGSVNCYLLKNGRGYFLIDTGGSNGRQKLISELEAAGCLPGKLVLVVLTHGDFDHSGNAAYLQKKFAARIAMHPADMEMISRGDMFIDRGKVNFLVRKISSPLFGFGKDEKFSADLQLREGDALNDYGLNASVLALPGHSKGSIGILCEEGDLFCGDLLTNSGKLELNSLVDEADKMKASVEKLRAYDIGKVYPGHGEPFLMSDFFAQGT